MAIRSVPYLFLPGACIIRTCCKRDRVYCPKTTTTRPNTHCPPVTPEEHPFCQFLPSATVVSER